jgi:hypothetical protein
MQKNTPGSHNHILCELRVSTSELLVLVSTSELVARVSTSELVATGNLPMKCFTGNTTNVAYDSIYALLTYHNVCDMCRISYLACSGGVKF